VARSIAFYCLVPRLHAGSERISVYFFSQGVSVKELIQLGLLLDLDGKIPVRTSHDRSCGLPMAALGALSQQSNFI